MLFGRSLHTIIPAVLPSFSLSFSSTQTSDSDYSTATQIQLTPLHTHMSPILKQAGTKSHSCVRR